MKTRTGIEVYRQADAARRLKVSRQRIAQLINEGKLHTVDEDGFRLVTSLSLREVEAVLKSGVKLTK